MRSSRGQGQLYTHAGRTLKEVYVPPEYLQSPTTRLHGVITRKTTMRIVAIFDVVVMASSDTQNLVTSACVIFVIRQHLQH
jgi:hypothetical protein